MEEEIILGSAKHGIEPGHGPFEDPGEVDDIFVARIEKIGLMFERQDVHLPLVSACERFYGYEPASALDNELTDADLPAQSRPTPGRTGWPQMSAPRR